MQFYEAQFSIWQKFLPTLVNFVNNWTIFHGCKWTNNENYKSHLVTLSVSHNILSLPFMFFLKVLSEMALSKYLFLSQNYLCYSLSLSLSLFPQCYISLFIKVRYMFVSLLSPVSLSVLISQNISLFLINLSKFFHYFLPQCSHSLTVPIACLTYLSLCQVLLFLSQSCL